MDMESGFTRAKRALFSPFSGKKDPKKARSEAIDLCDQDCSDNQESQAAVSNMSIDASSLHENIISRVTDALSIFKPAEGQSDDPILKLIPALATAISVAVGEVMKGVVKEVEERVAAAVSTAPSVREERLFAAVRHLTYENDKLQQYSRRESVRVFGVSQSDSESAEEVERKVTHVFKEAGVEVKPDDIAAVHRVGKGNKGPRPILVKFVSRRKRNEVMAKKKSLQSKDNFKRVFINDDVTPLRARLLGYVKRLEKVEKAWTFEGKIYCSLKSQSGGERQRPVAVETPDDLFKLGVTGVDYAALGLTHLIEQPLPVGGGSPSPRR